MLRKETNKTERRKGEGKGNNFALRINLETRKRSMIPPAAGD